MKSIKLTKSDLVKRLILPGTLAFSLIVLPPLIGNRNEITKDGVYEFRRAGIGFDIEQYSFSSKDKRTRFSEFSLFGCNRTILDSDGDGLAEEIDLSKSTGNFSKGTYSREKDLEKYKPLFEEADETLRKQRERFTEYLPR
jgi:hypothetical protein